MVINAEDKDLKDALAKLETAILTPVVSGELTEWVRVATLASNDMRNQLQHYREGVLEPQCAVISETDPDLLPRVQELKREDDAISKELAEFRDNLASLTYRAADVETDESKVNNHRSTVETQGLAFVVHVRRELAAAATWFNEALFRDRGTGD